MSSSVSANAYVSDGSQQPSHDPVAEFSSAQTRLLSFTVVLILLTQRLAIPAGSYAIQVAAPLVFAICSWGILRGHLRFSLRRFTAYLIAITLLLISTVAVMQSGFSEASLVYIVFLYMVLTLAADRCDLHALFRVHQFAVACFCVLGVLQYILQFAGMPLIDPLAIVPESFLLPGYNTIQSVQHGESVLKSNAGFFLEPSHLSKTIAISILIELIYFRRWKYLALFFMCYACTVSGTGLITLAVGLATGIHYIPRRIMAAFCVFLLIAATAVFCSGQADLWTNRAAEFDNVNASGRMRFITPYERLADVLVHDFRWFGAGAGSTQESFSEVGGVGAFPVMPVKLIYEYGLLPGLAFAGFVLYCLYSGAAVLPLKHASAVTLFLLTGGLLDPVTLFYVFFMVGMPVRTNAVRHAVSARPMIRARCYVNSPIPSV